MLVSWVAVDSRSDSSLYIVSDSRVTDGHGRVNDHARKLYACCTQPHIFGYVGWCDYPRAALERLVEAIDNGLFTDADNLSIRQTKIFAFLKESLLAALRREQPVYAAPFSIVHGARKGSGLQSEFWLWILDWVPGKGWHIQTRRTKSQRSRLLFSSGSGQRDLRRLVRVWQKSDAANTSRSMFSAFCDALVATSDPSTGGAPQLVGLFRKGPGRSFAVVYRKSRYLAGRKVDPVEVDEKLFCPNDLFERVDIASTNRLPHAQRQPRPRSVRKPKRRSIFNSIR
jgi:hypothetical protein